MYHPTVIEARRKVFETKLQRELIEYSPKQSVEISSALQSLMSEDGKLLRALSRDERNFIDNELALSKINFQYWCERYAIINIKGSGLGPMYPLTELQQLVLKLMGERELAIYNGEWQDGILLNSLKARQQGCSTLAEALGAHRTSTQNNIFGLIAADEPTQSAFLFDIYERIIENLPWWMKPGIKNHVKDSEMLFDGGSHVWVDSGKSKRGVTGDRGQLARGKTLGFCHLSELSTWEIADQIDNALMPACHPQASLLVIFESTAKGRGNYWHKHWGDTREGIKYRFFNVFIPWFASPTQYRLNAPIDWIPSVSTIAHAKRCEEKGERWLKRSVNLNRDQLYWYEMNRRQFESNGKLGQFLEEYAADEEECFQFAGDSIFPISVQQRIRDQKKPILAVLEVAPGRLLSQAILSDPLNIPKGYGINTVPDRMWKQWTSDEFFGHLVIYELPSKDYLYVMPADIGDGLGKDRSVIDIYRVGTMSRPHEQVAQFMSDTIDPIDLAAIMDVIGRFYTGSDNLPAQAAPEVNNHGIATLAELQRHLAYDNLYIWQYEDLANPANRFSTKVGWSTTSRSRPLIITKFVKRVKTVDPQTGYPDLLINSEHTIAEMMDFIKPSDPYATIADARAAPGAHDDCILTACIGTHIAETLQEELSGETLAESRKRLAELAARKSAQAEKDGRVADFQNTDASDFWDHYEFNPIQE